MYKKTSRRRQIVQRVLVNIIMTLSVFTLVYILTLFMLGYRLDLDNGSLRQVAFLQFSSTPSGATVSVYGAVVGSRTPNKYSVQQGKHNIVMWRDGYQTWNKSVDVKSGTITWLNYAILVPKDLKLESISKYKTLADSAASPKGVYVLLQQDAQRPTFELIDISSDTPVIKTLTIPSGSYTTFSADQSFKIEKWDYDGRYVLVSHRYGSKIEWLVVDTQNIAASKNITKVFDITIDNIVFAGTDGNGFYVLTSNDVRRLNLSDGTISKPVVSDVTGFDFYNESKVITWVRDNKIGNNDRAVGIYREGDDNASTIYTFKSSPSVPIHIVTTHYFNENYIAFSEGSKVTIMKGSYPNTTSDNSSAMKTTATFNAANNVDRLEFSPSGEFVFAVSGDTYSTYDLEYQNTYVTKIAGSGPVQIKWLDKNYIWSDRNGKLTIREFDGTNMHEINDMAVGQDAVLTNNGRYLYSIGSKQDGYDLQRVRMILP